MAHKYWHPGLKDITQSIHLPEHSRPRFAPRYHIHPPSTAKYDHLAQSQDLSSVHQWVCLLKPNGK